MTGSRAILPTPRIPVGARANEPLTAAQLVSIRQSLRKVKTESCFFRKDEEEKLVAFGQAATEDDKKTILDAWKSILKKGMNNAISDTPAGEETIKIYLSSVSLANQILLGCQTIAFVATLVGVILLLLKKVAKVSSKP